MIRKLLFTVITSLTLSSCERETLSGEKDLKLITLRPIQCGNPWEKKNYGANLSAEEVITNYLKENGVNQISNFEMSSDSGFYCQACSCPSGITIKFLISNRDYRKLKKVPSLSPYLK